MERINPRRGGPIIERELISVERSADPPGHISEFMGRNRPGSTMKMCGGRRG